MNAPTEQDLRHRGEGTGLNGEQLDRLMGAIKQELYISWQLNLPTEMANSRELFAEMIGVIKS